MKNGRKPGHSLFDRIAAEGDPFKLAAYIPVGSRIYPHAHRRSWLANAPGGRRGIHIGGDANKARLEAAWAVVQAEIDRMEATPEGRRFRELQSLARPTPPRPRLARIAPQAAERPEPQGAFAFAGGERRRGRKR
jgi:hypothetical protein